MTPARNDSIQLNKPNTLAQMNASRLYKIPPLKEGVQLLSGLCRDTISPSSEIVALARSIIKSSKVKPRDALHLACAETAGCDYFVTCDDALIGTFQRKRRRPNLKIKAINPVEFVRNEGTKYGQG